MLWNPLSIALKHDFRVKVNYSMCHTHSFSTSKRVTASKFTNVHSTGWQRKGLNKEDGFICHQFIMKTGAEMYPPAKKCPSFIHDDRGSPNESITLPWHLGRSWKEDMGCFSWNTFSSCFPRNSSNCQGYHYSDWGPRATGKAATIIVLRFVIHGKCLLCLTRCFCTVPKETKGQRRTHAVTDKVSVRDLY